MEFTAKTVEEAIELGLTELNLTKEDAEIEIIQKCETHSVGRGICRKPL